MCDKRDRTISCLFCRDLHITLIFSCLLAKDLFKRRWSLREIHLKKDYYRACHTKRFAAFFPLPSWCKATVRVNFARIWCITNPIPAIWVTPPWNVYMEKFHPGWEGYPVWQTWLSALAGHPTYHVNAIKLKWEITIMVRRVTPPKRVTLPTWGPHIHVKQDLRLSVWPHFSIVCNSYWSWLSKPANIKSENNSATV